MTRQDYKNRIVELEEQLRKKDEELKTMVGLWASVVNHPKQESPNKKMKIFGGSVSIPVTDTH